MSLIAKLDELKSGFFRAGERATANLLSCVSAKLAKVKEHVDDTKLTMGETVREVEKEFDDRATDIAAAGDAVLKELNARLDELCPDDKTEEDAPPAPTQPIRPDSETNA
jgi:hypothetical protein